MIRALILFFAALLTFSNTLYYPFVHDDIVIVRNPAIQSLDNIGRVFYGPSSPSADGINVYYRPLLDVIYRVEYALFGMNPFGWHAFNIVLHGINGILVWRLLTLLNFSPFFAFAAALLFIVHPVQSESVACVAGVSNLVMAFWVFATLIFFIQYRWFLSLLCFLLGLLTKEQAFMVVPLLILTGWYQKQKRWDLWVLFALWAFGFLAARQVLSGSQLASDILASPHELKLRLISIAQVLWTDLRILVFPHDLHYYRSTDILSANAWWWVGIAGLIAALVKSNRDVRFGAWWFLLALLPVLNIVPLINEYSLILTADHFLYVPMIGIMIIFGVLARALVAHNAQWKIGLKIGFGVLVVCMGAFLMQQNAFWKDEVSLFERTLKFEPNFARGHLLLAKAHYFNGHYASASKHFAKAYSLMKMYASKAGNEPSRRFYYGFIKGICFDWAHNFEASGQWEEAKAKYLEAAAIDPTDPVLWNNLGVVSHKSGNMDDAKSYFQKALNVSPGFKLAQDNLRKLQ